MQLVEMKVLLSLKLITRNQDAEGNGSSGVGRKKNVFTRGLQSLVKTTVKYKLT